MAQAKGSAGLGRFEGDDILAVGVGVTDAGKVLAKALELDPVHHQWKRGEPVYVMLECTVDHISHPSVKVDGKVVGVERKHNLRAEVGLVIDDDAAAAQMAEQRERLKAKADADAGIQRIDFTDDGKDA